MHTTIQYPTNPINLVGKQPRGTQPQRRPSQHTPRELFVLNCAREHDGLLPTLAQFNERNPAQAMSTIKGTNW